MSNASRTGPSGNRLLDLLPADEYQRLRPHLHAVTLASGDVAYEAKGDIRVIYFPISCVFSAVTVMLDGSGIEVATIGNEGATGLPVFAIDTTSPHRVFAQIAGNALRVEATVVNRESSRLVKLRETLIRYHQALLFQISQCVACNGLHVISQRCCRWLLMTQDRVGSNELSLSHEFLSFMLGVRRPSVTDAIKSLQDDGLVRQGQGKITVLDRKGLKTLTCECYGRVNEEYRRLLGS